MSQLEFTFDTQTTNRYRSIILTTTAASEDACTAAVTIKRI